MVIQGQDVVPVVLGLAGAVCGFLVAWGSLRTTMASLAKDVDELSREMKQLNVVVVRLTSQLAIHADREERDLASLLGRHAPSHPHMTVDPLGLPKSDP
jgi:hypothetical protein